MSDTEQLPFTIDLWADDELSIVEVLARASSLSLARVAFDAAAVIYPRRMLTLRGPGVCETLGSRPERPMEPMRRGQRGWTTGPRRPRKDAKKEMRDVA
jgi:hypothetical protein